MASRFGILAVLAVLPAGCYLSTLLEVPPDTSDVPDADVEVEPDGGETPPPAVRLCGGPHGDCPEGEYCYPGVSAEGEACGDGAGGICIPDDQEGACGVVRDACPGSTICLGVYYSYDDEHGSVWSDWLGLCLEPALACEVGRRLPSCFYPIGSCEGDG